jgi:hypothetical protein
MHSVNISVIPFRTDNVKLEATTVLRISSHRLDRNTTNRKIGDSSQPYSPFKALCDETLRLLNTPMDLQDRPKVLKLSASSGLWATAWI